MTSICADSSTNSEKKIKLSENEEINGKRIHLPKSFEGFCMQSILNEDTNAKSIFIEGSFANTEGNAVVILEKLPFGKENVSKILCDETSLINRFNNDIYGSYYGFPKSELNGIKATIIHPATKKHFEKYKFQPQVVVRETTEIYNKVVLPHIDSQQLSLDWVYNILNHKSETDRIIFEDSDPNNGFILLPDLKWDESETTNLYTMALCNLRGVRSLRDLTAEHIPMLKNIYDKGCKAIYEKYKVTESKLRVYLHYLPSYYHLHVHFTSIDFVAPGIQSERAHLLDIVIKNLELMPDYYKKATLVFCVKENEELYKKLSAFL